PYYDAPLRACLSRALTLCTRLQPPPLPALFAYTTLFRSNHRRLHRPADGGRALARDGDEAEPRRPRWRLHLPRRDRHPARRGQGDRKSTRLNSSHVKTSYAVFCLKKKTKAAGQTAAGLLL